MSISDELGKLGELRQRGVLTEEEFGRAKARVLGAAGERPEAPGAAALNALRRSRDERWLGGVCGGIGRATGVATWIWRLLFLVLAVFGGTGILLYVLLWILMPDDPQLRADAGELRQG